MLFNEDNQPDELLGCHKIIQACSHFPNIANLDLKAHYMTIHLRPGSHVEIDDIIYRKISRALIACGFASAWLTPGLILDHDRAGSRHGCITNDSPHLHGLLFTGSQLSYGDRLRLNWVVDLTLSNLRDVASSTTQIYIPNEPLGMVADYNGKLAKLKSKQDVVDHFPGKIYPIDRVRTEDRRGTDKYLCWMDWSDKVLASFYSDPTQFFSAQYCQKFRVAINQLAEYGKEQPLVRSHVTSLPSIGRANERQYITKEGKRTLSSETDRRRANGRPVRSQRQLQRLEWWKRRSNRRNCPSAEFLGPKAA